MGGVYAYIMKARGQSMQCIQGNFTVISEPSGFLGAFDACTDNVYQALFSADKKEHEVEAN